MNSDGYSYEKCLRIVTALDRLRSSDEKFGNYLSNHDISQLLFSCESEGDAENSDRFSKPMVWIGIYIAVASFFCIIAMASDLLHGFRSKKLWFPCKYFSLNAAYITVIAITLKLPVDLSSTMPSYTDQATKLGSLGFMCTMMANLMPSLASMDNNTLLANVTGNWKHIADRSPYKWSTTVIFITQSIGVMVGTIAPAFRCFSILSFKLGTEWNRKHFMFFKVEKYWTQKLHEWRQSPIPFLSISRISRSIICNSKDIILTLCIRCQKVVVVSCKVIWLIATIFVVNCFYFWKSLKARWFTSSIASRTDDIDDDLGNYTLRIDNNMELAEKSLKGISNSMNSFILKAVKEQNNNLLKLLEKSTGFKGVEIFDTDHVQPLLRVELVNSWSLPIVTLTCIAISLPNIPEETVVNLLESVCEGLSYSLLVEESLNCSREFVNLRKASMALWYEVENKCKWLDNPLAKSVFKGKTTTEIIKWFSDKAKEIVIEINGDTNGELVENPSKTLIAANSMYRITQTILLRSQSNIEPITKKQLFAHLNGMIADIFCACFTNIPQVIRMRCHESVIEKREASVKVAAKLLGKTTKIIERLETCDKVPSMDDEKMTYIDEWRLYLKQSIP